MATQRLGWRPVALALVMQDGYGNLMMVGSKKIDSASIEVRQSVDFEPWGDALAPRSLPPLPSIAIHAECYEGVLMRTAAAPLPASIEQRGIYLPDMSFRALPAPEDL